MVSEEDKGAGKAGKRDMPTRVSLSRDKREVESTVPEIGSETTGREPAVLSQRDNVVVKPGANKESIFTYGRRVSGRNEKSKISVLPFSVILPTLGELSRLAKGREELMLRFEFLREHREGSAEEVSRELFAEEQMLKQVVQWLTLSGRESLS